LVGFNYMKNPAASLAKQIIDSGEIGEIWHIRGTHVEDYMTDPSVPYSWRLQRKYGGPGSLGDLCHIINMAQYLVGEIVVVCGDTQTVIKERPIAEKPGEMGVVENDDHAHFMVRFANGAIGTLETSRVATGRKMGLTYEISASKGSICFDQERMSELKLYLAEGPNGRRGFRTILMGPDHPDYGAFSPAAGHGLGYNDQKVIEIRDLVEGIVNDRPIWPDFRAAYETDRVVEAVEQSAAERCWVHLRS
jgi:predicted dehydrogenase